MNIFNDHDNVTQVWNSASVTTGIINSNENKKSKPSR